MTHDELHEQYRKMINESNKIPDCIKDLCRRYVDTQFTVLSFIITDIEISYRRAEINTLKERKC